MDLSEGSRREERELLGTLSWRWEARAGNSGECSLVQNRVWRSWGLCSGGSGQLRSVGAKRNQQWDAVFVQGFV